MKTVLKRISVCFVVLMVVALFMSTVSAFADTPANAQDAVAVAETVQAVEDGAKSSKAYAAAVAIGLAALGGAIAMGMAIAKSSEGIARQPEAEGKIRTSLMLGLVFIETAIIYALIVAILIIFVL